MPTAMAPRGAGRWVQISHCAHPCSNNISIPSIVTQPAEAAALINQAVKEHGTGLIDVRRIDAAKEIAETLSKSNNVMYLPGQGANMLFQMGGK